MSGTQFSNLNSIHVQSMLPEDQKICPKIFLLIKTLSSLYQVVEYGVGCLWGELLEVEHELPEDEQQLLLQHGTVHAVVNVQHMATVQNLVNIDHNVEGENIWSTCRFKNPSEENQVTCVDSVVHKNNTVLVIFLWVPIVLQKRQQMQNALLQMCKNCLCATLVST